MSEIKRNTSGGSKPVEERSEGLTEEANKSLVSRGRRFGDKRTERILYSINKQLIELHRFSTVDEVFNQELNDQKEEMNKIIEDFQKVLASNKISFDQSLNACPPKAESKDNKASETKIPVAANTESEKFEKYENPNKKQEKEKKSVGPEIKYPVSLKSLNSNQNFDPIYREVVRKTMENNHGEYKQLSSMSNQNLSQKVNSLINESREKKKSQTQKFLSKN